MDEPTLLKIAILSAVAGIIGLFFIARVSSYDFAPLNAVPLEKTVTVRGFVDRVDDNYLKIRSIESLNVRVFEDLDINRGDLVEVTGRLDDRDYFLAESIKAVK